jgi:uncharacterized protein (TIGR02145 family)
MRMSAIMGGVKAEVVAVIGIGLIALIAAATLAVIAVTWFSGQLKDHASDPRVALVNNSDGETRPPAIPSVEEEDHRRVEAESIQTEQTAAEQTEAIQTEAEPVKRIEQPINDDPASFIDPRDGKKYRAVKIGGKRWMAQNLNYDTSNASWCYMKKSSFCDKYGRLYDWNTAKAVCPDGWRLPTSQEWESLGKAAGGEKKRDEKGVFYWSGAGKKLKAKSGWNDELRGLLVIKRDGSVAETRGQSGNGTDDYGFSATPGDFRFPTGDFGSDIAGHWWTATEIDIERAYQIYIHNDGDDMFENKPVKTYGFSVRCVEGR